MPVTPTGPISEPLAAVETLLSNSATFQTWTGAADAAAALNHIHVIGLPTPAENRPSYSAAELSELRPMAVLNYDVAEPWAYEGIAQGQYTPSGRVLIALEADVDSADARNFKEAAYTFLNAVGKIIEEMAEASEGGGYPVVQRVRLRMQPRRSEEKERPAKGDYLVTIIGVEFGLADS